RWLLALHGHSSRGGHDSRRRVARGCQRVTARRGWRRGAVRHFTSHRQEAWLTCFGDMVGLTPMPNHGLQQARPSRCGSKRGPSWSRWVVRRRSHVMNISMLTVTAFALLAVGCNDRAARSSDDIIICKQFVAEVLMRMDD